VRVRVRIVLQHKNIDHFTHGTSPGKYEHDDGIDRREFENRQLPIRFLSASAR